MYVFLPVCVTVFGRVRPVVVVLGFVAWVLAVEGLGGVSELEDLDVGMLHVAGSISGIA